MTAPPLANTTSLGSKAELLHFLKHMGRQAGVFIKSLALAGLLDLSAASFVLSIFQMGTDKLFAQEW